MIKVLEINVDDQGNSGVYNLIRNIIMHKPDDIQIDLAAIEPFDYQSNIDELHQYGSEVYYVGYKGNKFKKQKVIQNNLINLIQKNHYDLVHIHSDVAYKIYVYASAAKKAGCKNIIMHSHATDAEEPHRDLKIFMHKMTRKKLKKYGTVFASCSRLAGEWMYPNIPSKDIQIIYNGVDLKAFCFNEEVRNKIRNQYHIDFHTTVVGHVGRFSYQKNHEYLLQIFEMFHKDVPDSRLLLLGDGKDMPHIKQMVQDMHLEDAVIFTGIQKNAYEYYQAMDVFVLPSRFEGFPIVGVEAQASGLPLLFSDAITKEAGLCKNTVFLPTDEASVSKWVQYIEQHRDYDPKERVKAADQLKQMKFDISDTEAEFINLYRKVSGK